MGTTLQEGPARFSLAEFKALPNVDAQQKYASQRLRALGEGSARIVYALSSKYVLKLAIGDRGVSQNQTEAKISTDKDFHEILARVHQHSPDYTWIVSDLVRPLREEEFKNFVGIDFKEFVRAVRGHDHWRWQGNPNWKVSGTNDPSRDETIGTYGLIDTIKQLIKSKKLYDVELTNIDHWGKTGDNRIVILDYGVDDANWKEQVFGEAHELDCIRDFIREVIKSKLTV